MKIAHFSVEGMEFYGSVEGDRVRAIQGSIFGDFTVTGLSFPLTSITLLPPTRPTHFWGIGENYPYHVRFRVEQFGQEVATRAKRFTPWHKGASAVVASGQLVIMPVNAEVFEYEGELCIVIGRPARKVSIDDAPDYILGYTVSNDISSEGSWHDDFSHWRRKGCDTFGPAGPWIDTEVEPHHLDIITRVNGVVEDQGNIK
ncbi:MAG: fumarylacetoacetate hydrolase family protein, partial [Chloroflexota bacterium]